MPALKILNRDEKNQFELPPDFDSVARKKFFRVTADIRGIVDSFNPIRKVGFILQLGYFKYTSKFFSPAKFNSKDVDYVCNQLNITTISLDSYYATILTRHRDSILKIMGFDAFSVHKKSVANEISELMLKKKRPRQILKDVLDYLAINRIEIPTYRTISEMITECLNE